MLNPHFRSGLRFSATLILTLAMSISVSAQQTGQTGGMTGGQTGTGTSTGTGTGIGTGGTGTGDAGGFGSARSQTQFFQALSVERRLVRPVVRDWASATWMPTLLAAAVAAAGGLGGFGGGGLGGLGALFGLGGGALAVKRRDRPSELDCDPPSMSN